jgi:putative transposase
MEKYKNKYRIPSARLQNWDYGQNGAYFITICTHNRQHFFGEIVNNEMQLSEMGQFAEKFWLEIPIHFPFVELGNFVVMPNHTHGILIIDKNAVVETLQCNVSTSIQTLQCNVSSTSIQTLHCNVSTNEKMAKISPKPGSISTIIRSYKSAVTKHVRKIHADFDWQTRFHDHIIRSEESFERIQTYIANNPANWDKDKFY